MDINKIREPDGAINVSTLSKTKHFLCFKNKLVQFKILDVMKPFYSAYFASAIFWRNFTEVFDGWIPAWGKIRINLSVKQIFLMIYI